MPPTEPTSDFTPIKHYDPPILGRLQDGSYLKIESLGNHAGHSMAWQGADEFGKPRVVSFNDVVICETTLIAPTRAQVEQLLLGEQSRR